MPSISTSLTPVVEFPGKYAFPFGNDQPSPLYSSVPLGTTQGQCMPNVLCVESTQRLTALKAIVQSNPVGLNTPNSIVLATY